MGATNLSAPNAVVSGAVTATAYPTGAANLQDVWINGLVTNGPQFAAISAAVGLITLVTAQSTFATRVLSYFAAAATAATVQFFDTQTIALSGPIAMATVSQLNPAVSSYGLIETTVGVGVAISVAGSTLGGHMVYVRHT